MDEEEDILNEEQFRFTIKPITKKYQIIWDLYKKQVESFWTAEEIDYSDDYYDFKKLDANTQHFIEMVLAFFAASDGIVNLNIREIFSIKIKATEAQVTYGYQQMMENIHPKWKDQLIEMSSQNKEEALKFAAELSKKRQETLRIIYALDEFIWEGQVGRSRDIQTVQLMETFMSIADAVVLPTHELKEAILIYKFIDDPFKEIYVIPSSVNMDFFPLFKNFNRDNQIVMAQLRDKPKVLVKGLSIPENVNQFIIDNYKKMQITVCSVGELSDHVMGLISRRKINHIYHWANPYVNKRNLIATYAFERDLSFDFAIHTKPDNLKGNMYELTLGEEDVLFSIAYGAIPICGIDHLGYDDDIQMLSNVSGLTFGKDTPAKKITGMIERLQSTPVLFNEAFNKYRQQVENRISSSPYIMMRYFSIMMGKELSQARNALLKEKQAENEQKTAVSDQPVAVHGPVEEPIQEPIQEQEPPAENSPEETKADNVIAVDFSKKSN